MKEFLFLLGCCFGFLLGFAAGYDPKASELRNEAVSTGHAEYYLDSKYERQWRWKPTPQDSQP